MDEIESIGMSGPLPLTEIPGRTACSVSIRSGQGTQAGGEVRTGDSDPAAARRRDLQEQQIGKDFESVLLSKVFEQVQASIQDSGFDEEDGGAQQVRGLFWYYLAQDVSEKGGFGLWKDVYQQIKQMEDAGDPAGSVDEEL